MGSDRCRIRRRDGRNYPRYFNGVAFDKVGVSTRAFDPKSPTVLRFTRNQRLARDYEVIPDGGPLPVVACLPAHATEERVVDVPLEVLEEFVDSPAPPLPPPPLECTVELTDEVDAAGVLPSTDEEDEPAALPAPKKRGRKPKAKNG